MAEGGQAPSRGAQPPVILIAEGHARLREVLAVLKRFLSYRASSAALRVARRSRGCFRVSCHLVCGGFCFCCVPHSAILPGSQVDQEQ